MQKLARAGNSIYVTLSLTEFRGLAKVADVDDIVDGTNVSLAWIKNILDNVSSFQTELAEAKTHRPIK